MTAQKYYNLNFLQKPQFVVPEFKRTPEYKEDYDGEIKRRRITIHDNVSKLFVS